MINFPTKNFVGVGEKCGRFEHCGTECTKEMVNQMENFICSERDAFAALLLRVPVHCKDVLVPPLVVKRADVECLFDKVNKECYIDVFCFLRVVCMHKTGTVKLQEERSNFLIAFLNVISVSTVENLQCVALEHFHIPKEHLAEINALVFALEVSE